MPELNFNLYNFSGDMLAFLREEELTPEQQENILGVLGLSTEGLEGPQGEQGFHGFKYDIRRTDANNNNGYVIGEIVEYQGSYYICLRNNDAIIPTNTTYWAPYSFVGPQGPQGQSSSELLKPYLYNKYLETENFSEFEGGGYWYRAYEGDSRFISGPWASGYEDKFIPDGVRGINFSYNFITPFDDNEFGYDPLPYSIEYIGIDEYFSESGNNGATIINILNTIAACDNIINIPAPFGRTLDFSILDNYYNSTTNESEGFFNESRYSLIVDLLDNNWDIFWPLAGLVPEPYQQLAIFPSYTPIGDGYYCQIANDGNIYYTDTEPPMEEEDRLITDFTIVNQCPQFPYRVFETDAYFTYQNDGGSGADIFFYQFV